MGGGGDYKHLTVDSEFSFLSFRYCEALKLEYYTQLQYRVLK